MARAGLRDLTGRGLDRFRRADRNAGRRRSQARCRLDARPHGDPDLRDAAQVRAAQPEGPARRRDRRPQLARVTRLLFDLNGTLLDPGEKSDELKQAVTLAMAETLSGGYRPFSDFMPNPPEPKLFGDVRAGLEALREGFRM